MEGEADAEVWNKSGGAEIEVDRVGDEVLARVGRKGTRAEVFKVVGLTPRMHNPE
jgi:hypothetical protein